MKLAQAGSTPELQGKADAMTGWVKTRNESPARRAASEVRALRGSRVITTLGIAMLLSGGCARRVYTEQESAPETEMHAASAGSASVPMTPASSGIIGVGSSLQCEASACERESQAVVASIAAAGAAPGGFTGGHCGYVTITGLAIGTACTCDGAKPGGSASIGPLGAGCYVAGRAGICLWDDSEYEPCSMEEDKCPELCKELEARQKADAEAMFDAELRSSSCDMLGHCHRVLRVGDRCYVDDSLGKARSYDCALSDEQLLEQNEQALQAERDRASCMGPTVKSGTCTVIMPTQPGECVPRPAEEWQGLLVCWSRPPCSQSANCGLALACVDEKCTACSSDDQCAPGEGCALDHCVPSAQISCHVRADCKDDELCILSGFSDGPRANADMRAYCQGKSGSASQSQ